MLNTSNIPVICTQNSVKQQTVANQKEMWIAHSAQYSIKYGKYIKVNTPKYMTYYEMNNPMNYTKSQ